MDIPTTFKDLYDIINSGSSQFINSDTFIDFMTSYGRGFSKDDMNTYFDKVFDIYFQNKITFTDEQIDKLINHIPHAKPPIQIHVFKFFEFCFKINYLISQKQLELLSSILIIPQDYIILNNYDITRELVITALKHFDLNVTIPYEMVDEKIYDLCVRLVYHYCFINSIHTPLLVINTVKQYRNKYMHSEMYNTKLYLKNTFKIYQPKEYIINKLQRVADNNLLFLELFTDDLLTETSRFRFEVSDQFIFIDGDERYTIKID